MNTPRKIARKGATSGIKCRVCNNDVSQDKHRVDLFGAKSQREGVLECLQRFLQSNELAKLHEDDGLSRHICRSCELKILAFLKKEVELKTLFMTTECTNRSACEGERFKRGRVNENNINILNIDQSPSAAGLPKKKPKIILAPKFDNKPPACKIDLMSRFSHVKPALTSSTSKITPRLAPKFNTPLPPRFNQISSYNSANTSIALSKKKRILPNMFRKEARSTDMEKGAKILNNVVLHKVNAKYCNF